jgi:hypothetical protein
MLFDSIANKLHGWKECLINQLPAGLPLSGASGVSQIIFIVQYAREP